MTAVGSGAAYLAVSAFLTVITDLVLGETCMKAVRRSKRWSSDSNNNHDYSVSWYWVNFECSTGCCGETTSQRCCEEESDTMDSPGVIVAVSVGVFLTFLIIIIVIVVCFTYYRSRRKQSQRMRRRRHPSASATPSANSLPPSYEMSLAMSAGSSGNAFPAEVHQPPSYNEVMAWSSSSVPLPLSHNSTAASQPTPREGRVPRVHGHDNPAFTVTDES